MGQSESCTDVELIDAFRRGDDSAFPQIYFRYRDWVASLALRFTGNREDALDVTQEVFLYLAGKIPSLVLTAKMTTFLYPAVKNLSLAVLRRKKLMINDEALLSAASADPPGELDADRTDLAAVMGGLPEAQREVVLMRFVDGFSLDEIAGSLKIPLGTVKSRLHLAIVAMKSNPRILRYFGRGT